MFFEGILCTYAGRFLDVYKRQVQYTLMMQSSMDVCMEERKAFKVWHGIAGAELLRTKFGVTDEDVLHAVRFHTCLLYTSMWEPRKPRGGNWNWNPMSSWHRLR